jgi:segregation and condensation protein B
MGKNVTDTTIEAKERAAASRPGDPPVTEPDGTGADQQRPAALEGASPPGHAAAGTKRGRARPEPQDSPAVESEAEPGAETSSPAIDPAAIAPSVEAILLSSDRPVPPARIAEAITPGIGKASAALDRGKAAAPALAVSGVRAAVELLNEAYAREGRSFRIEPVSGGLRIMTRPEHAEVLARFHGQRAHTRLSRAAIESLAIIAYRQPITRAEIESIRGVASGEILKTLMERRLVTITGRAEELGRPMLYGTTRQFLETFGLASLKDLPPPEEFGLAGPTTQAAASGTVQAGQ